MLQPCRAGGPVEAVRPSGVTCKHPHGLKARRAAYLLVSKVESKSAPRMAVAGPDCQMRGCVDRAPALCMHTLCLGLLQVKLRVDLLGATGAGATEADDEDTRYTNCTFTRASGDPDLSAPPAGLARRPTLMLHRRQGMYHFKSLHSRQAMTACCASAACGCCAATSGRRGSWPGEHYHQQRPTVHSRNDTPTRFQCGQPALPHLSYLSPRSSPSPLCLPASGLRICTALEGQLKGAHLHRPQCDTQLALAAAGAAVHQLRTPARAGQLCRCLLLRRGPRPAAPTRTQPLAGLEAQALEGILPLLVGGQGHLCGLQVRGGGRGKAGRVMGVCDAGRWGGCDCRGCAPLCSPAQGLARGPGMCVLELPPCFQACPPAYS